MELIFEQAEVTQILKDYILKNFNVKAIDVSCYSPYTFEVVPVEKPKE